MIGLDTNVLLRSFLGDDPRQTESARKQLQSLSPEAPGVLSPLVLAEFAWTLRSRYRMSSEAVRVALRQLQRHPALHFIDSDLVGRALANEALDFPDALIAATHARAGCARTLTLDAKALRDPHFQPAGA